MTTNRIFIRGRTSKKKNKTCTLYLLFSRCDTKEEARMASKKPGELVLEECPAHCTKEERDRFFAKMRQRVQWAKIGLSDKNEL